MLRMRFLPSDFDPVLLVLGTREELRRFAGLLTTFARWGRPVSLAEEGGFSPDTRVRLTAPGSAEAGRPGLWRDGGQEGLLLWTLDRGQAVRFAGEIADLADGASRAGSAILDPPSLNGIAVKVSLGEFEDDFLLGGAW